MSSTNLERSFFGAASAEKKHVNTSCDHSSGFEAHSGRSAKDEYDLEILEAERIAVEIIFRFKKKELVRPIVIT